jgi:hypothetical protein
MGNGNTLNTPGRAIIHSPQVKVEAYRIKR